MPRRIVLALAVGCMTLMSGANALGDNSEFWDDYGHATNGYTGDANGSNPNGNYISGPYCAATSIANSFQYLANRYGGEYEQLMEGNTVQQVRDDLVDRESLATTPPTNPPMGEPNFDGTGNTASPPVDNATIWNSKITYIGTVGLAGQISVSAMIPGSLDEYLDSEDIVNSVPTLAWLTQQIQQGEDVEMGFQWTEPQPPADEAKDANEEIDDENPDETGEDGGQSHMVVITAIDGDDFDYLDPNNPNTELSSQFFEEDNTLFFNWNNMNNDAVEGVEVVQAWSESPVPEPASATILMVAVLGLARRRSRAV